MPTGGFSVVFTAIRPKKLWNNAALRRNIQEAMSLEGRTHRRQFQETTSTWKGSRPRFITKTNYDGHGNLWITTYPGGGGLGAKKWHWLDQGTRIRYATMSRDWVSKTRPKSWRVGRGRGRMLFVSKRHPRPGITARDWSGMLERKRKREFSKVVQNAIKRSFVVS